MPGDELGCDEGTAQDCGSTSPRSLAIYTPHGWSSKTSPSSLDADSTRSPMILPASGMWDGGELSRLPPSERPTSERASSCLLPTPTASDGRGGRTAAVRSSKPYASGLTLPDLALDIGGNQAPPTANAFPPGTTWGNMKKLLSAGSTKPAPPPRSRINGGESSLSSPNG